MLGFSPLVAGPLAALPVAEASGTADAYVTAPMGGVVLGTDGSTFIQGSAGTTTAEASASIAVTATASAGIIRPAAATAATAVTATASADRYRTVDPAAPGAPILNYFCAYHSAMGGATNHSIASTTTYVVTVAYASGGNKYYLNGVQQPLISLAPGATYTFDQSHSSNSNHPLRLSTTPGGTHFGGSTFSTNVSYVGTPGQAGSYTRIVVPSAIQVAGTAVAGAIQFPILANVDIVATASTPTPIRQRSTTATAATAATASATGGRIRPFEVPAAPVLYYGCANHLNMGAITTQAPTSTTALTVTVIYGDYANYFAINGVQQAQISLAPGGTYTFDQSHVSNAQFGQQHPLRLSTTASGHSSNPYTKNVTVAGTLGQTGSYTQIYVPPAAQAFINAAAAAIKLTIKFAQATAAIAATATAAINRIRNVDAQAATAITATNSAIRRRSTTATAGIALNGTAEIGGSLETASATANVAITAIGGNLLKVKPTSATAAVSATSAGAASRVRHVSATADISVTGTSDRMAYIGMSDAAQISVIAGDVSAGATKIASATAATAVTASATPRKVLTASATASAALGANVIATKLTLKITSASAATAVTAAASCVALKSASAIAPIVVTSAAAPRAIFGGAATSDILVTATAVSNATIHGLAPANIAVNGAVIAKLHGDDWGDIIIASEVDPWTTISTTANEPVNPWTIL